MENARLPQEERVPCNFLTQNKKLTELRAEKPWIEDLPRNAANSMLRNLDGAFKRFFKNLSKFPRFKKRGRDSVSICEPHSKAWRIDRKILRFPKIGNLKIVQHLPIQGSRRSCKLVLEVDQWFAVINSEQEVADPIPRTENPVGIDRGLTNLIATSDGELFENPRFAELKDQQIKRAHKNLSRKKIGSKNRLKSISRLAKKYRTVRRSMDHFLHTVSSRLSNKHGVIVLEKLEVDQMILDPRFSKGIGRAAWSKFLFFLKYKQERSGGSVHEVPAQYTSQECHECRSIDESNRSGASFHCLKCGYQDHADLNAAKVILKRFQKPDETSGSACGGFLGSRSTPMKQESLNFQ